MLKLYIAEKPSLGKAIASVLPKPHVNGEGFIRTGNGDCVSWCIGHLLEQVEPDAYNPEFKHWKFEHLPIIPELWQLKPKSKTSKQLSVLRKLIKEADSIVHAGDPDREGQLLVDQVIDYLKVCGTKRETIQRCLISDLNAPAVKRALQQLRPNSDFIPLSTSALARSRADWLYGINMTRAYTLQGRKAGFNGLLSVGRVQTPVLGLVVRRDMAIEAFISKPFYEVLAHLKTMKGDQFTAKWQPSEACVAHMDEDGRVLNKALAENVVKRIEGKKASVQLVVKQPKTQVPPLPYSLSALQIDAGKRFSMSAKQVLDSCQVLYERYKLITYPRSDSRYLPEDHFKQGQDVINVIGSNAQSLSVSANQANSSIKGRAWNDKKVDAHHAIIPTLKKMDLSRLTKQECQLYEQIARQYLCQFYPKWEFNDTRVELVIEGGLFVAKSRVTKFLGWKSLFEKQSVLEVDSAQQVTAAEHVLPFLPDLKKGETLDCERAEIIGKNTQAPSYFTDATLLAAMTGIARYVADPEVRKVLKDTDGLGTEATRAGILDLMFKRDFLKRKGKYIHSSETARALVDSLPLSASTPDMTAQWEATLNAMSMRQVNYASFMNPLTGVLKSLIQQSQLVIPNGLKGLSNPKRGKGAFQNKKRGKKTAIPS